ncbi:MAG: alternative ribosome rescue aminoacyl-tRNA hydrolase ArfB [Patescibacteria group bacterium]|nr:alternative ribosome rescue aminoacyl-tRNA hydrolase ArfB [Patescibacteria group bacterium]
MNRDMNSIPAHELHLDFVRSSGPGGQKVNKTSSKVQLRWRVGESGVFAEEQKALIRKAAGHRLNADDEIIIVADAERSQYQNRDEAVRRLQDLVARALTPKKTRRPTKISRAQKQKRLDDKRRQSEQKKLRRPPQNGW